jgi:hypothetical protein
MTRISIIFILTLSLCLSAGTVSAKTTQYVITGTVVPDSIDVWFFACVNPASCGNYVSGSTTGICDCAESIKAYAGEGGTVVASEWADAINVDAGCATLGISASAVGNTITITGPGDWYLYVRTAEQTNCGGLGASFLVLDGCSITNIANGVDCDETTGAGGSGLTMAGGGTGSEKTTQYAIHGTVAASQEIWFFVCVNPASCGTYVDGSTTGICDCAESYAATAGDDGTVVASEWADAINVDAGCATLGITAFAWANVLTVTGPGDWYMYVRTMEMTNCGGLGASFMVLDGCLTTNIANGVDCDETSGIVGTGLTIVDGGTLPPTSCYEPELQLDDLDLFGASVAYLGDVNGDGVGDLISGAYKDDDGGTEHGAAWILFLDEDGLVVTAQKISDTEGGFTGALSNYDHFGIKVAALGDLNGDFVPDAAVGATGDDDDAIDAGAVWILFLNSNGTVKSHTKITEGQSGFTGVLETADQFALVSALGDINGDGVDDLAVGSHLDDDGGGIDRGAVYILFMDIDGTVKSHQKISDTEGGFTGTLNDNDYFGCSTAWLDDIDDDGKGDIAVGAMYDDDGGTDCGAVYILFLDTDGTVLSHQKISNLEGDLIMPIAAGDRFGHSVGPTADLGGYSGNIELAVCSDQADGGGTNRGELCILYLYNDGRVYDFARIGDTAGSFGGTLHDGDAFGRSPSWMGDHDGDGQGDIVVGAPGDDDGGNGRGAVWELFLFGSTVNKEQKISDTEGSVPSVPVIQVTPGVVYFNTLYGIFNYRDVSVTNISSGTVAVNLTPSCAEFVVIDNANMTILPGSTEVATLRFYPTAGGDHVCTLATGYICDPEVQCLGFNVIGTGVGDMPQRFALNPNVPNPFNPTTAISFELDRDEFATLSVYDVAGRLVRTLVAERLTQGTHTREWDGTDNRGHAVSSGVYFFRLQAGQRSMTRKAVLLK